MRARQPDRSGVVERDGVRVAYEVFDGPDDLPGPVPTVMFLPTWSIVPSRTWKAQVPSLARRARVVTFDGRGCGASDRPVGAEAYAHDQFVADVLAVLDATDTDRAVLVALSAGAAWAMQVAHDHPERVLGVIAIAPATNLVTSVTGRDHDSWYRTPADGIDSPYNRHVWLEGDYDGFLRWFFGLMFCEPHSTKQIEDCVGWGQEIGPARLADTTQARLSSGPPSPADVARGLKVPVLVIHGDEDRIRPHAEGVALAELTGGSLVTMVGSGHGPHARDPVRVNQALREFVDHVTPRPAQPRRWVRAARRSRRALFLSSPIGLGHVRRDLAIAAELRRHHSDLQLDWLTQEPVSAVLTAAGERVHPASAHLAAESAHIEEEADEHDLHVFQAIRRMDEILVNNFTIFDDLVGEEHYDLVIADEAWDVDHFLHENPELKRFAFAWLTDFVGWLPMPEGGAAEAALTADYNAEMVEQRARFRRVRDRSIFVGSPQDVIEEPFGPGLPSIRAWTEAHFDFSGYITGFARVTEADRAAARRAAGCRPGERLGVVTVGGSGVGETMLRRVLDAVPTVRRAIPDLRFLVVTGPRIDPHTLPRRAGVTLRGYVPDLYRHLAAADVALVQGGLTTCMELTANRVPFLYCPLRHHFEQNLHVRHRLAVHRAGHCVEFDDLADPGLLAKQLETALSAPVDYRPVETDGAARAAAMLAELI